MHKQIRRTLTAGLIVFTPVVLSAEELRRDGLGTQGNTVQRYDSTTADLDDVLDVKEQNGIRYVSGGVGDEEQQALSNARDRFNLKVSMATTGGKYMSDATIQIQDQAGKTVLEAPTSGPLFLAELPAGQYKVKATGSGHSFTRSVTVRERGQQEIVLSWPSAAGEERIQAGDAPEQEPVEPPTRYERPAELD